MYLSSDGRHDFQNPSAVKVQQPDIPLSLPKTCRIMNCLTNEFQDSGFPYLV